MIVAGIDIETTGYHDGCEIIEIGYCIYDMSNKIEIAVGSDLIKAEIWDVKATEAENIHGISEAMTKIASLSPSDVRVDERILVYKPRMILSHNAAFDHAHIKKHWPKLCELDWLCTYKDLDHSKVTSATTRKLTYLALEYGVPVHDAHRAVNDARLVCQLASYHDLVAALAGKNEQRYKFIAIGPYNVMMKEILPKLGFRWFAEPDRYYAREEVKVSELVELKRKVESLAPDWKIVIEKMLPKTY